MELFTINYDWKRAAVDKAMEEEGVFFWVRTPEELETEAARPYHAGRLAQNRPWRPGEVAATLRAATRAREILTDETIIYHELDL